MLHVSGDGHVIVRHESSRAGAAAAIEEALHPVVRPCPAARAGIMRRAGDISVCAVVGPGSGLEAQTRAADDVVAPVGGGTWALGHAVTQAVGRGHEWIWIVDARVRLAPDALAELLAPMANLEALGDPILFASKVVTEDSVRLDMSAPPWPRLLARELAMAGADHRLVALRAVRAGSLLVHRRAVERHGAPRGDFAAAGADLEWTGRVLRDEPGYLVPTSLATRAAGDTSDPSTFTRERVRILRGDGWRGQEKAWFAFLLAQDLVQQASARPGAALGLLRAVGRGLRAPA